MTLRHRIAVLAALAVLTAGAPAAAQRRRAPVQPVPAVQPDPALSPEVWWANEEVAPEAHKDPLGGRRYNRRTPDPRRNFSNGVEPTLYRLWGLQPLQNLVLRRGETVYELWYRTTKSTRQAVIRAVVRNDGRAFVQARAGLGCCAPEIARRVDIDAELPPETRQALLAIRNDPLWTQPRHVVISEAGGAPASVCVDGAFYDLTLVDERRAIHLRRACDPAEIGSIAPAAQVLLAAALGRDPRFDDLFTRQNFTEYAGAYQALVEGGGQLASSSQAFAQPLASEAPAQSTDAAAETADAVAEILAADRAFAARSAETTAAQAFREFMDKDGLLFREDGEPARGVDAIYARFGGPAAERGKLLWEPVEAWASEDGTLGASWGRSRFVPVGATQPAAAYRYMTVWRRDADGRWKGLMDVGVSAKDLLPEISAAAPPLAPK